MNEQSKDEFKKRYDQHARECGGQFGQFWNGTVRFCNNCDWVLGVIQGRMIIMNSEEREQMR